MFTLADFDHEDPRDQRALLVLARMLIPRQRERVSALVKGGRKKRPRILAMLAHDVRISPAAVRVVSLPHDSSEGAVAAVRLHTRVKACYVISQDEDIDGRELSVREAIDAVMQSPVGHFLVLSPSAAVYKSEDGDDFALLLAAT